MSAGLPDSATDFAACDLVPACVFVRGHPGMCWLAGEGAVPEDLVEFLQKKHDPLYCHVCDSSPCMVDRVLVADGSEHGRRNAT